MLFDYAPRRGITLDWHKHTTFASDNNAALARRAAQMAGHARQNSVAVLDDTLCGCTSTSMTTALIILLASVVGTALITSTATWLLLRCRYSRTMSKSDKGGRQSPSQPSSPRWQTWARSAPRPKPTAQPGDDLRIGIAIDDPGQRMPDAEGSAGQANVDGPSSNFLAVRRRPEYASGLSSTFMFPRKDPGITTTIISDATMSNSRKLKSKRLERSRSRRKSTDPEPEQPEETPPRMSEGGGIGSTDRLVPSGDRTAGAVLAPADRSGLDDVTGSQSVVRAPSKSAVDAMRDRLHSSSRASNRTGSPALSSRAPTIPKRSSLRVEVLPAAPSGAAAPSPSFYHVGSGFPENSLHAGLQTPFASLVQLAPAEEQQQREVAPLPGTQNDDDEDPPRPSTSDTIGSPERSRRPHRPRKGTLTMFPKIQDGPPPVSLATLVMSTRPSSDGQHQQHQQEDEEEEMDHAGEQQGSTAIPLRKRSYSESSTLVVPEDSVPPRRSFGPNWPFAPV